jgi:hypothetical protein
MRAFEGEQGSRLVQVIRESEAPVVGFHCGYSAENVYKMKAASNVPKPGIIYTDPSKLSYRISRNIAALERLVNSGIPEDKRKQVILETLEYMRERPLIWDIQSDEVKANRKEMEETLKRYGINCGQEFITDPSFIEKVLETSREETLKAIGFLFDVGHNFIAADSKKHDKKFHGTIEDYFDAMLKSSAGRTYQVHLTVPGGNQEEGYLDIHNIFKHGQELSERIIELARLVVARSHELKVVTLEMNTGLKPIEHAEEMIRQTEYARNVLNLN